MEVYLATISGWGTNTIIGVFSTPEIALNSSISHLLSKSESKSEGEIMTPYNMEMSLNGSLSYDITNSDDVLLIHKMSVDIPA